MINYPNKAPYRHYKPKTINKPSNKYGAVKTTVNGLKFDSKVEAEYYRQLKLKGVTNFKMQEEFILLDGFRMNGKKMRAIKYKPDFTFYDDAGNLIKVVDVKGKRTDVFNIKAKMFMQKYDIPLILAMYDYRKKIFREEMA